MWLVVSVALLILFVVWCDDAQVVAGQSTTVTSFAFDSFQAGEPRILTVLDAEYYSKAYELNYFNNDLYCGRMLYRDKVRLKDQATGAVTSFNASFTFSFISAKDDSDGCGEGMAFSFVARPNITRSEELLHFCSFESSPKLPSDRVFAVKVGSREKFGMMDLSDGTIGVVVTTGGTSYLDVPQYNLCTSGYAESVSCGYFCGSGKGMYSIWIDYDSQTKTLAVFFRPLGTLVSSGEKPETPVITVPNLALDDVLDAEMYAALTGKTYWLAVNPEVHRVHAWYFNTSLGLASSPSPGPSGIPDSGSFRNPEPASKVGVMVGVFAVILVVVCGLTGLCVYCVIRKYRNKQSGETVALPPLPLVYTGPSTPGAHNIDSTAAPLSSQDGPTLSSSWARSDKVPYVGGR